MVLVTASETVATAAALVVVVSVWAVGDQV
jgi:hypothetical protein